MKMFHFRMKTTILKLVKKQKMVAITMTMFFCSALHLQRTGRNHPNKTRVKACRNRSSHRGKFCFIGAFDSDYLFHVVKFQKIQKSIQPEHLSSFWTLTQTGSNAPCFAFSAWNWEILTPKTSYLSFFHKQVKESNRSSLNFVDGKFFYCISLKSFFFVVSLFFSDLVYQFLTPWD